MEKCGHKPQQLIIIMSAVYLPTSIWRYLFINTKII